MSIIAIVNPVAGRGSAAADWMRVRAHLKGPVETLETKARGHATELAAQSIKQGAATIVAVGGDGTLNEVVNGFFEQGQLISETAMLGIVPHGTGSDFTRMLRLPVDGVQAAALIEGREPRLVDLLKVNYTKPDGTSATRHSLNITSFGLSGDVASRVGRSSKKFGRKMSYLLATIRTAATFGGKSVTISFDGSKTIEAKITNVAVGNGRYHGAGLLACPRASIDDGLLDVTLVEYLWLPDLMRSLPLLYNGKIYEHAKVRFLRVRHLRAESNESVAIEVDGEPLGRLPIEIFVVPRAIRVLAN